MMVESASPEEIVNRLIQSKLKPYVRKIDEEAWYPLEYLTELGKSGMMRSDGLTDAEVLAGEMRVIEETSKTCMTTGFNLWCHYTASTYLRKSEPSYLKSHILPLLENGDLRGGTGLSNPMKYYAGLEKLRLKARRTDGGYIISGQLSMVSNLGQDHWFGVIASVDEQERIMVYVPCNHSNLRLTEQTGYLGLNGSATYSCKFEDVFIQDDWVISDRADEYVTRIRPNFLMYQIPLGLGVADASIKCIRLANHKQEGCNQYLGVQSDELEEELNKLREQTYLLAADNNLQERWKEVLQVRLSVTNLALKTVHACMLHQGGPAYLQYSDPARRLREAYFLVNLTPTIRHLEKLTKL